MAIPKLEDLQDVFTLPCGCVTGVLIETQTFVMIACPKGDACEYVIYTKQMSRQQNKPIFGYEDLS
jgi:hypothetical protein